MVTEADTCRKYVVPKLVAAGWEKSPHSLTEQKTFTDGRIIVAGRSVRRGPRKRADYLLRYTRDLMLAVVEAKAGYKLPGDGLQQAKEYAEILDLPFAYSTNGEGVVECDFLTGRETELEGFPSPDELWSRYRVGKGLTNDELVDDLLTPLNHLGWPLRYYQEVAVARTVEAILRARRRVLLTMATGTGKTTVAFQICWKLWSARWNKEGGQRKPRILYLSDRSILVDDPKDNDFAPFGEARYKIEDGVLNTSREMYFATYQAIAHDEHRPGLYREYSPDFFDLVIVDECHRGSARAESNWREILTYFASAYQLGMTATPLREDNRDTYAYFGNPIYTYSLRQGIADGFLAPYRVHRIVSTADAVGWRPGMGELDRHGRPIPDELYETPDFEVLLSIRNRTEQIARHLTDFLRGTDPFAKTIVFCVDQEHADEMRRLLVNLNSDRVREQPDYVCRVTADEGDVGRGHLAKFQDVETRTPVILTTSRLLTTGINAPTCKNIVLVRLVHSMTEFKQIIGRGTRVRDDYGKMFFNILDYTGSATVLFADPEFDGDPVDISVIGLDDAGTVVSTSLDTPPDLEGHEETVFSSGQESITPDRERKRKKFYVEGGEIEIVAHLVYELDSAGHQLRVVEYRDYAAQTVRSLYAHLGELRRRWGDPEARDQIIDLLETRGVSFDELCDVTKRPDADPFDLLCHLAFDTPILSRRDRAARVRKSSDFWTRYEASARNVLESILSKYAEFGISELRIPEVLKVPPVSEFGNVSEIAERFGGPTELREAVVDMQELLYAA